MIDSIHIENFKGHRDTTVPLGRLTVLVGPNGSGKTSVLEALWLQSELATRGLGDVFAGDWSTDDLVRREAPGAMVLASSGTRRGTPWSLRFQFDVESGWRLSATDNGIAHESTLRPYSQGALSPYSPPGVLTEGFGRATLYKLNAARIASPGYTSAEVGYDGTNAAVALAQLKLAYDDVFDRIESEMRELVPNILRVRIRQAQVTSAGAKVVGSKIYFDFRGAPGVPAHAASEGTLIILAILTVLHSPNPPNVLLLDDFDQSLHPQAQVELVRLLKRLLQDLPQVQIVATTHSPYILDEIDPSDVHVFALRDDGTVAVKRLSEHPEAAKMKGALTAGQLWSLDPERDWVLRENAA